MNCDERVRNYIPEKARSFKFKRIRSRVHQYHNIALAIAALVLVVRVTLFATHHEGADAAAWFIYDGSVIAWLFFATALNWSGFFTDPYCWVPALKTRSSSTDWISDVLHSTKTAPHYINQDLTSVDVDWLGKFAARAFPNSRIWPERRLRLFTEWTRRRPDSIRWIVQVDTTIGYTCVLPLRHEAAENMKCGALSWYEIRPGDLALAGEHVGGLFVQAICIDQLYNTEPGAVDLAILSFADHVAEMLFGIMHSESGAHAHAVPIIAEATSMNTTKFLEFVKYEKLAAGRERGVEQESSHPFPMYQKIFVFQHGAASHEEHWLWRCICERLAQMQEATPQRGAAAANNEPVDISRWRASN